MQDLEDLIRTIPDYPKPGIMFRDITTLLADPKGLKKAIKHMAKPFEKEKIEAVAGIEARGFILGGAIAEGTRVLIVDDLIATGGTAEAAAKLVQRSGGKIVGATFIVDLPDLGGMKRLSDLGVESHALVSFGGH